MAEEQARIHRFPKAAIRELSALVCGLPRSAIQADMLPHPYPDIIRALEAIPSEQTLQRSVRLSELCSIHNIDINPLQEALLTEDLHILKPQLRTHWPKPMRPEAFYGGIGDFVNELAPTTEADVQGIMLSTLIGIGNIMGRGNEQKRGPFIFGGGYHFANNFGLLVGESAAARKGTCWTIVQLALKHIDPDWVKTRIKTNLSTGEGLIQMVQDDVYVTKIDKQTGDRTEEIVAPGVEDKRLMIWAAEFASILQAMARPGVTLPSTIREAWDGGDLSNNNKTSPAIATSPHISIMAAITKQELMTLLKDTTNVVNGFANRILWCLVRKARDLSDGGTLPLQSDITDYLNNQVIWADKHGATQIFRDPSCHAYWDKLYTSFDSETYGIHQHVTSRGIQHIIRLSLIYALMDHSLKIKEPHIRAAKAVWDYCSDSARIIFGESTGDPLADRILDEIEYAGDDGLSRTDLIEKMKKTYGLYDIKSAITLLEDIGLIISYKHLSIQRGKYEEVYHSYGN